MSCRRDYSEICAVLLGTRIAKTVFKKNKVGGISVSDLKTYHRASTMQYRQTDEHTDRWQRTENPKIDSQICPTDFDKGAKVI